MEIEAKFLAPDHVFTAIQGLEAIGPFQLKPEHTPETQRNVYYDTADTRLRNAHYGLRVRHIGARQIATLKGAATIDDGLYTRGEWESDVQSDDPHAWPAGELRERVLALMGDAPLQPTLEIQTSRQHVYAFHQHQRFAEISLDTGTMIVGARAEPFREIEIELVRGGERADFDQLVAMLREQFPLTSEPRSKLERAIALLESRP